MKTFLISLLFLIPLSGYALEIGSEVPNVVMKNQFDEPMPISASTKKLIFTPDKKAATMMNEYLEANPKKLDESNAIYVSDISKMPSLITKTMAMPAMKKYPFKIALDREGEITKNWPREKDKLTLLELNNQKVVSIRYLNSKDEIAAALTKETPKR